MGSFKIIRLRRLDFCGASLAYFIRSLPGRRAAHPAIHSGGARQLQKYTVRKIKYKLLHCRLHADLARGAFSNSTASWRHLKLVAQKSAFVLAQSSLACPGSLRQKPARILISPRRRRKHRTTKRAPAVLKWASRKERHTSCAPSVERREIRPLPSSPPRAQP
jgi:hypothetical protein